MGDKIKLTAALAIVIGALVGFYAYADQSLLIRVVALLVATGIAATIAVQTEIGGAAWGFSRGSLVEVRKVVWPTRRETIQTTLMVMVMVVIVGLMLWGFDMFLAWIIRMLTGQGG